MKYNNTAYEGKKCITVEERMCGVKNNKRVKCLYGKGVWKSQVSVVK